MLCITQEFLNSWQELSETFMMDIKLIFQNVVSTTWKPSANLAGIPQVPLVIFTKVQETVNRSVATHTGYKKQWFNSILYFSFWDLNLCIFTECTGH